MTDSNFSPGITDKPISLVQDIINQYTRENPALTRLLNVCTVLRWFDLPLLNHMPAFKSAEELEAAYSALIALPICEQQEERGYALADFVSDYFLFLEGDSIERLDHHRQACNAYRKLLDEMPLEPRARFYNPDWKVVAAEWLYHLCRVSPEEGHHEWLRIMAESFAVVVSNREEVEFCSGLHSRVRFDEISWPPDSPYAKIFTDIRKNLDLLLDYEDAQTIGLLEELANVQNISDQERASIYQWIGSTYLDIWKLGRARERLQTAHQLCHDDFLINLELSRLYSFPWDIWTKLDLAEQYARYVIDRYPDKSRGYEAMGNICMRKCDWEGAIGWYKKALEIDPESADACLGLSDVFAARRLPASEEPARQDDLSMALQMIDQAEVVSPGMHYYALIRKGNVFHSARRYEEAREFYETAYRESPERTGAALALGDLYAALHCSPKAAKYYQEALEKEPGNSDIQYSLAILYENWDREPSSVEILRQALKQEVKSVDSTVKLAGLYARRENWSAMEQVWKEWLEYDNGSAYLAYCSMGSAFLDQALQRRLTSDEKSFFDRARHSFSHALMLDPDLAWAHIGLAQLAILSSDATVLETHRLAVVQKAPWAEYEMLDAFANVYLSMGEYDETEQILNQAVCLAPHRVDVWRTFLELYREQEQNQEFVQGWEKLAELDSAFRYEACLERGNFFQSMEEVEQAFLEFSRAAEVQPLLYDAFQYLGNLKIEQGLLEEGWEYLRKVAVLSSDYAVFTEIRLSEYNLSIGDFGEAEKNARKAIEMNPELLDAYSALANLGIEARKDELLQEAREALGQVRPDLVGALDYQIGEAYYSKQQFSQARRAYLRSIGNPSSSRQLIAQSRFRLGDIQLSKKHFQAAHQTFEQALEMVSPLDRYNRSVQIGESYESAGLAKLAEKFYKKAAMIYPKRPIAYLDLAALLRQRDGSIEAHPCYEKARMSIKASYLTLGRYYENKGKPEDALACYQLGIENATTKDLPELYLAAAYLHVKEGAANPAERDFLQAIELAPDQPDAYIGLMQLFIQGEKYNQASVVCKKMAGRPALADFAYLVYGQILANYNLTAPAIAALRQAMEANPKNPDTYTALVQLFFDTDQIKDALAIVDMMASQPELAVQGTLMKADLERQLELYSHAEASARSAIQLDPQYVEGYLALARVYFDRGLFRETEQQLVKAVQVDPKSAIANKYLADLRNQMGMVDEAVELYRYAGDLMGELYRKAACYIEAGRICQDVQRNDEAAMFFRKAIQNDSENIGAWLGLGVAKENLGRLREAATAYSHVLEINPKIGEAYVALGRVYGLLHDSRQLQKIAKVILQLDLQPEEVYDAHMVIAASYAEGNVRRKAEDIFRQLIQRNPERPGAYQSLAGWLHGWKRPQDAAEVFQKMAEQPDLRAQALRMLAQLYVSMQQNDEAVESYRQAIEADGEEESAYFALVQLLHELGRDKEAEDVLKKLAEQPGKESLAYRSLGDFFSERNQNIDAEAAYQQAIKKAPEDREGYLYAGRFFVECQQYQKAEELLKSMPESLRDDRWYLLMATLCERQYRLAEAIHYFRQSAWLNSDGDAETVSYLLERAGELSLQKHAFSDAIEALCEAVKRNPKNSDAWFSLGKAYDAVKDQENSIKCYTKVVEIEPKFFDAYTALGRIYGALDQFENLHRLAQTLHQKEMDKEERYQSYQVAAYAYWEGKYFGWAVAELEKAIAEEPHKPAAYYDLGNIYLQKFRFAKARDSFEKAFQASKGQYGECRALIGLSYLLETEDLDPSDVKRLEYENKAETELQSCMSITPDQESAYRLLAKLYEGWGRLEDAVAIYEMMSTRIPALMSSAYLNIASIRRRLHDHDGMHQACSRVLSVELQMDSPVYLDQLRRKGLAHFMLGDYSEAEGVFQKVIEANPSDSANLLYAALNHLCLGKSDIATAELKDGLSMVTDTSQLLYPIEEAQALVDIGPKPPEARDFLTSLLEVRNRLINDRRNQKALAA